VLLKEGMTLDQFAALAAVQGVFVDVHHADASSVEQFRRLASAALARSKHHVVVNYRRTEIGQGKGGHISPLAAYDAHSDRFLVLDVARYRYAPVSPLYLFGRRQDIALQKGRSDVNQRNHMRLWLAPVTLEGQPVWVGQISRDIGVRLTRRTITTHKIDPAVDETRWYLLQDLYFSDGLDRFGFVAGVGASKPEQPRTNFTGDPYVTDGRRAIFWMTPAPALGQRRHLARWIPFRQRTSPAGSAAVAEFAPVPGAAPP
jgi:hypothetical protein